MNICVICNWILIQQKCKHVEIISFSTSPPLPPFSLSPSYPPSPPPSLLPSPFPSLSPLLPLSLTLPSSLSLSPPPSLSYPPFLSVVIMLLLGQTDPETPPDVSGLISTPLNC